MRAIRALWMRFRGTFEHARSESDFAAEVESHVALHTEDGVRAGLNPAEARRQALIRLGGAEQTRQAHRERRSLPGIENLLQDARYAVRQLYKAPGFTIAAVLTLALAIGANTAIFSVVNAVLLHPAGVDHPERVAVMNVRYSQFSLDIPFVSVPDYSVALSMKDLVETAAIERATNFNIIHDGRAEHVASAQVSWRWFQVFGGTPILGRTFAAEEDQANTSAVTVLSYGLWQRDFGGRSDAVGQMLILDRKPYRIVGIMRSDFVWPRGNDLWTPIALPSSAFDPKNIFNENYHAVVRLRAGVSVQQFNARLAAKLTQDLRRGAGSAYAKSSGWRVYTSPITEFAAGPLRKPLYVLFGVVALILLIASANVAGLLLARSSARSKEFAIRAALGASVLRLAQQLLIETALLAAAAAALGIASGPPLGRTLLSLVPQRVAEGFTVRLEPAVLAFTAAAALLTCLIAGLGPAFKLLVLRTRLQLTESSRGATTSAEQQRLRSAFVIGQVALSFLLLTGTGLFLVSLQQLQQTHPGFDPNGVIAARIDYAGDNLKNNQQRQAAFIRGTVDALTAQPGVQAAAAVEPLPFEPDAGESSSFDIKGRPKNPDDPGPHSHLTYTTPDYLKVMRISLLAGRWIGNQDQKSSARVVVVDQRLAHRYWPNQSPLGQQVDSGAGNSWATVVGVVGNIRSSSLEEDTTDGMRYYPFAQVDDVNADFLVRTAGDSDKITAVLRNAVASADPSQTVTSVTPLETLISDSLAGRRLIVWMLAAFAALALLLAMIGIYGLIGYLTAQRTNEIGIRMALGAQRKEVVSLVLRSAVRWVLAGLSAGIVLSLAATALLRHVFLVFGGGVVQSLALSGITLLAVGMFACLIPARRAASIDPTTALRTH